jgi:hypothetical protein
LFWFYHMLLLCFFLRFVSCFFNFTHMMRCWFHYFHCYYCCCASEAVVWSRFLCWLRCW